MQTEIVAFPKNRTVRKFITLTDYEKERLHLDIGEIDPNSIEAIGTNGVIENNLTYYFNSKMVSLCKYLILTTEQLSN